MLIYLLIGWTLALTANIQGRKAGMQATKLEWLGQLIITTFLWPLVIGVALCLRR
jgi:hypothetical protein